jgi:hypothetical protein
MLQSKSLQKHLMDVYHASLQPDEEEMERRRQNSQRGRGRGRSRGRGNFSAGAGRGGVAATWSQDKGDRAAVGRLKRMRLGGPAENEEVEEFVRRVIGSLEEEQNTV